MMEQVLAKVRLYLPHVQPFLPHATALFVFALLGWMNGYFQSSRAIDNPNLKDTWSVPNWTPYHTGPERALITTLDIWDGKKPQAIAAKPEPAKKAWQFVGTTRTGKAYAAVILLGDEGRIQRVMSGDLLPNGEKILAVGNGSLQIDTGSEQREIKLFQPEKK